MGLRWRNRLKKALTIRSRTAREILAEFLGSFILVVLGNAAVAQFVLGKGKYGEFLSVNWGWGMAVSMGLWSTGGVSEGYLNPAVTLTMCVMGRIPWKKLFPYWLGQYLGAFLASFVVFIVYKDSLNNFDGGIRQVTGPNATAMIWATYPQDYLTSFIGFVDQVVATAMFFCLILALTDKHNPRVPDEGMIPFFIGLIVFVVGMTFGINSGYAINPARDWAPRMFTLMAGWGTETFSIRDYNWFWIPILGPHLGAIVGAGFYQICVGIHNSAEEVREDEGTQADEEELQTIEMGDKTNVIHLLHTLQVPARDPVQPHEESPMCNGNASKH